tara:strand:- start:1408 stop:1890 length:483 start_codon:yes stop_codon:yes gene_type:complete
MLIGCSSNPLSRLKTTEIDCPKILFSNEDTLYFGSYTKPLNIENISYQAELNNGQFLKGCKIVDNLFSSYLSILFILSPLQEEQNQINLPYYVATIDSNKNLKDIQYYSFNVKFNKNSDTKKFEETEIVEKILLKISNWKDTKSIVLGFMLDEERKKILN